MRTASLGDSTYVVIVGGAAVVVDPQRDLSRFLEVVEDHGARVTHVLETHMHNDYISGGRDLAARTGADLIMPAASGASFAYIPAFHGEPHESEDGFSIHPIHTPGHTPAHTSYVISANGEPKAAFHRRITFRRCCRPIRSAG